MDRRTALSDFSRSISILEHIVDTLGRLTSIIYDTYYTYISSQIIHSAPDPHELLLRKITGYRHTCNCSCSLYFNKSNLTLNSSSALQLEDSRVAGQQLLIGVAANLTETITASSTSRGLEDIVSGSQTLLLSSAWADQQYSVEATDELQPKISSFGLQRSCCEKEIVNIYFPILKQHLKPKRSAEEWSEKGKIASPSYPCISCIEQFGKDKHCHFTHTDTFTGTKSDSSKDLGNSELENVAPDCVNGNGKLPCCPLPKSSKRKPLSTYDHWSLISVGFVPDFMIKRPCPKEVSLGWSGWTTLLFKANPRLMVSLLAKILAVPCRLATPKSWQVYISRKG